MTEERDDAIGKVTVGDIVREWLLEHDCDGLCLVRDNGHGYDRLCACSMESLIVWCGPCSPLECEPAKRMADGLLHPKRKEVTA